jgi:hypothetical protein
VKPVFLILKPVEPETLNLAILTTHVSRAALGPYLLVVPLIAIVSFSCTLVGLYSCLPGLERDTLEPPTAQGSPTPLALVTGIKQSTDTEREQC